MHFGKQTNGGWSHYCKYLQNANGTNAKHAISYPLCQKSWVRRMLQNKDASFCVNVRKFVGLDAAEQVKTKTQQNLKQMQVSAQLRLARGPSPVWSTPDWSPTLSIPKNYAGFSICNIMGSRAETARADVRVRIETNNSQKKDTWRRQQQLPSLHQLRACRLTIV